MSGVSGIGSSAAFNQPIEELNKKYSEKLDNGLSGSAEIKGDNIVISVRDTKTGELRQAMVGIPTLDPSKTPAENKEQIARTLELVAKTIDGLVADLKNLAKDIEASIKNSGAPDRLQAGSGMSNVQKTLFDIYQVITLLQKAGIAQREMTRKVRWSELNVQIKAIDEQAKQQLRAAKIGLIVSCVTTGAQVGMMGFSAVKAGMAQKDALNTSANQQLKTANTDLKLVDAPDAGTAHLNTEKMGGRISWQAKNSADATFGDKVAPAEARFRAAENALGNNPKQVKARIETNEAAIKDLDTKISNLENDIKTNEINLNELEKKDAPLGAQQLKTELKKQRTQLENLKNEQKGLREQVQSDNARLQAYEDSKQEYLGALDDYMAEYDTHFIKARSDAELAESTVYEENGKVADLSSKQDAVGDSGKIRNYVKARVVEEKFKLGEAGKASIAADRMKAMNEFKTVEGKLGNSRAYAANIASAQKWGTLGQTMNAFSALNQSLAHYFTAVEEAKATKTQGDQKRAEQARDETAQLMSNAQQVLTDVNSLLKQVIQDEDQSINQILRA